jgi:hypothetical protein
VDDLTEARGYNITINATIWSDRAQAASGQRAVTKEAMTERARPVMRPHGHAGDLDMMMQACPEGEVTPEGAGRWPVSPPGTWVRVTRHVRVNSEAHSRLDDEDLASSSP